MRMLRTFATVALALVWAAAPTPPASAQVFTWSQNGGFLLSSGDESAGSFFGNNPIPVPGSGGLDFFGLQPAPAPGGTYSVVGWGCAPDGNNTGGGQTVGAVTCANNGVIGNAVVATNPATIGNGRSALVLEVFNDTLSGGLDAGSGLPVVIAKITHVNNVIDNEANTLESVTISSNLQIDATPVFNDLNDVPITFLESANAAGNPATVCVQTPNPLGSNCDDEFTFNVNDFVPVFFTHNGDQFFLQFEVAPAPECATPAGSHPTIPTIQIFQCADDPLHRVAIDFTNGKAWAMENFNTSFLVTMKVVAGPRLRVVKTPDGGTFQPGGQATFTIVVSNPGQVEATNVVLNDALPGNGGLVWETATSTQGTCVSPIVGNALSCSLGTIAPGGSVTVTVQSTATTPLEACQSQPNPAAIATADLGLSGEDSGSLNCSPPGDLRTVTQGGWGSKPAGNNPGMFLQNNFGLLGGNVVIGTGGPFQLTFTSAAAIRNFLPQGGTAKALTASATDPTAKITVFAGQVLALQLNVAFSNAGALPAGLGSLVLTSGPAAGQTVLQVLIDANRVLGGGALPAYITSISQLNDVATSINEMFN